MKSIRQLPREILPMQGMGRGYQPQAGGGATPALDDRLGGGVDVLQNVHVAECERSKPSLGEPVRYPACIVARTIAAIMRLAVDLDDQAGFVAIEVGDVAPADAGGET
jgi:hypothetical protein